MLEIWLTLGITLIIIEIFSATIVLLFAGISAIIVGGFINYGLLAEADFISQFILFFISCFATGIIFWSPVNNFINKKSIKKYSTIIGAKAVVIDDSAQYGKDFKVKWSGVKFSATLSEKDKNSELKKGDSVTITAANGTKLTVTSSN